MSGGGWRECEVRGALCGVDATRDEHSPHQPAQRRVLAVAHDLPDRWVENPSPLSPDVWFAYGLSWAGRLWTRRQVYSPHRALVAVTVRSHDAWQAEACRHTVDAW